MCVCDYSAPFSVFVLIFLRPNKNLHQFILCSSHIRGGMQLKNLFEAKSLNHDYCLLLEKKTKRKYTLPAIVIQGKVDTVETDKSYYRL